jgi:hypothetical protein
VVDPNFAPIYATRSRRTKTDRRDARTLMEACRLGAHRCAHRLSAARRHVRAELVVREALVGTRTRRQFRVYDGKCAWHLTRGAASQKLQASQ